MARDQLSSRHSNTLSMDATPATEGDLKKLTVAQLKALCKEKQITGYSKLAKPNLIQKLLDHAGRTNTTLSVPPNSSATPAQTKKSFGTSLACSNDGKLSKTTPAFRNPSALTSEPLSSSRLLTPPPSQNGVTSLHGSITQTGSVSGAGATTRIPLPYAHIITTVAETQRPSLKSNASPNAASNEQSSEHTLSQASQDLKSFGAVSSTSSTKDSRKASGKSYNISTSRAIHPPTRPAVTSESVQASASNSASDRASQASLKRHLPILETHSDVLAKKNKLSHVPNPSSMTVIHNAGAATRLSSGAFKIPEVSIPISLALPQNALVPAVSNVTAADMHYPATTSTIATGGKRFTPLVLHKKITRIVSTNPVAQACNNTCSNSVRNSPPSDLEVNSSSNLPLHYLDFPVTPPITLSRITLPPSLSQRKQVARFAIILSQVAKEDLSNCVLGSRMFRYATYLSATARLKRDFPGRRLDTLLQRLPPNMTNLWPYLHQREGEAKDRRRVFDESFLRRVLQNKNIIAARLWTSPDNDKQIGIALRFLLTRFFFSVSLGGENNSLEWLQGTIIDVQEIVSGEVWCIIMKQPSSFPSMESSMESFYVLESTCEVVGFAPSDAAATSSSKICPIRADWSAYIAKRASHPSSRPISVQSETPDLGLSLMDRLSWTNHEEYEKGISKLWLKRIDGEGNVGRAKKTLAERYVLACVVENSVSGRWMSSTQMAQEFSGLPTTIVAASASKMKTPSVHLFLPAHHHVESVHFTTVKGLPLHPALAVVQTPGREYFVLRDNGMQVGCEEDGIAGVWMRILGCTARGELERA